MIRALAERYRETGAPLVVSQYGGENGAAPVDAPPILYHRSLFAELLSMTGEGCAKRVVRRHRGEAAILCWPEHSLRDIDVTDDYEYARAQTAGDSHHAAGSVRARFSSLPWW